MKKDNKPYDSAFKDLADQDPEGLLLLLGALPPGAKVKALPREVTTPALLPDQPYEVISETEHFVAHVEAQTRYEQVVPERFVDYGVRLWLKYRLPVRCYLLVYLRQRMPEDAPASATIQAGGVKITVEYTTVRLWELSADEALKLGRESLLPFVPLMSGGREELELSAQRLEGVKDEARQRELALHFVVLSGLRYNREEIFELIGRSKMIPYEVLKESSIIQWAMEEGMEKGMEKGIEQGIEKGIEKGEQIGRREELLKLLQRLIAKRFPDFEIGDEVKQSGDLDALEELVLNLDEVPDELTLRARLDAACDGSARLNGTV